MMTLDELRKVKEGVDRGEISAPPDTYYVNNHIHTTYSFSPYNPAEAVYMAWKNGLKTAGIMDHDSAGGAKEFIEAGKIIGMPVTCGIECRIDMSMTSLNGRRINNPDQKSVAYVAMHGIPHQNIDSVDRFLAPYREKRNIRNRKMCENISEIVRPYGFKLDFDTDVLPISNYAAGGSVTERHILFALAKKITARYKTPDEVLSFLENEMKISISPKLRGFIAEGEQTPDFYEYDILGVLKSDLVEKFYIPATDECPEAPDFIKMVHDNGGIAAYAYLGDVGNSVTGDKKAAKFEDDYLDELVGVLLELGFDAITYMPTRNTLAQLQRIMKICEDNKFFQISGEDINSPRQSFICHALDDEHFKHLIDNTYTLIGYEQAASENLEAAKEKYSFIFE
ncbi:MAG: PHP domain-containing protein [Oscillospiraceae bacterium]|nr:MAG: PHP domain-containing protein [Oscillospiraceae bacterium]